MVVRFIFVIVSRFILGLNKKKFFIINIDKVTYASNFKNISSNIKNYKFYKQDINNKNFINLDKKSFLTRKYCPLLPLRRFLSQDNSKVILLEKPSKY